MELLIALVVFTGFTFVGAYVINRQAEKEEREQRQK